MLMAPATHYQGFPLASGHPAFPRGHWKVAFGRQIGQLTDMMHFNLFVRSAEFTGLCQ
jgi:hypothetical protein